MSVPTNQKNNQRSRVWLRRLLLASVLLLIGVQMLVYILSKMDILNERPGPKEPSALRTLETNLARYKTMTNKLPDTLQDLVRRPEGFEGNWRQLANEGSLRDSWGEPYQYRHPGIKNPAKYDIFSKGPDQTEGTPDDIGN